MPPFTNPITLALELLIGGLALSASARYVASGVPSHARTLGYGVLTAIAGAIVWAVLSWVPLVGLLLALLGWLAVVKWRYPVTWTRSVVVAVGAWVVSVVVVAALGLVGVNVSAFGVPGA